MAGLPSVYKTGYNPAEREGGKHSNLWKYTLSCTVSLHIRPWLQTSQSSQTIPSYTMSLSFALPNGHMPAVGYGCWKVGKDTAADLIEKVIRLGYRHIDSACDYANEKEVSK